MTDAWLTVLHGDCRAVLPTLEAESVNCVVSSPPYWGLRDYGTATWDGGDPACDHRNGPLASPKSTLQGYTGPDVKLAVGGMPFKDPCGKCGAIRQDSQIGLEPTPEEYVETMVGVFREVRRVLRSDGTVWLNLGDSYVSTAPGTRNSPAVLAGSGAAARAQMRPETPIGLKPKDLVGIPWRVAFALQADGWYLRSDIIWSKPNPMPESVTDRPTKSHEYVFLLTKSPRYWYDADAVRERSESIPQRRLTPVSEQPSAAARVASGGHNPTSQGGTSAHRNLRSVWTIATQPYPGAHFATFPEKLVEPCVLAGCPEGGVVLDPFAGTGTVGMVAQRLSRRAVLIDLNGEYIEQMETRNAQTPLGLAAG